MSTIRSRCTIVLLSALGSGCAGTLPGSYFDVTLETAKDQGGNLLNTCQSPPEPERTTYTYRLVVEGPNVQVFLDTDLLATGGLEACALTYQSTTWESQRTKGSVRWAIAGNADVGLGSGCTEGWTGSERLQVVDSSDPDVPGGCTIQYDVTGTHTHDVE